MGSDQTVIRIAKDFAKEPAGRYTKDGPDSGERFREDFLLPALKKAQVVRVELDGTEGYGSSFLEEAFGGLVRLRGFQADDLHRKLFLVSEEDESILVEIWDYIDTAKPGMGPKRKR